MSSTGSATEGANSGSSPAFAFQSADSNHRPVNGFGATPFSTSPAVCSGFAASSNSSTPAGFEGNHTCSSSISWSSGAAAFSSGINHASASTDCNNAASTSTTASSTGGAPFVASVLLPFVSSTSPAVLYRRWWQLWKHCCQHH